MKNLAPRLVGEVEAKMLGVAHGWYGTKASGTFVTGPSLSLDACIVAMDELPEPIERTNDAAPIKKQSTESAPSIFNTQARTAYQIGSKPRS